MLAAKIKHDNNWMTTHELEQDEQIISSGLYSSIYLGGFAKMFQNASENETQMWPS